MLGRGQLSKRDGAELVVRLALGLGVGLLSSQAIYDRLFHWPTVVMPALFVGVFFLFRARDAKRAAGRSH